MKTEIKTRLVAGKEMPESILIENGVLFTEKWIKERNSARCFLHENVLCKMADECAKTITFCDEETRIATKEESKIIHNLAFAALLGLNHGETARMSSAAEDAIINAAEYAIDLMIPNVNGYITLYTKLRHLVENWRNHTEAEIAFHYGAC